MTKQFRLLRYVLPHWRQLLTILLTMGLTIGLNVLRPWPTKILVDQVLGQRPKPAQLAHAISLLPGPAGYHHKLLLWVCISTVFIFLAGTVFEMVKTLASTKFGQSITYDLAADMFSHLQQLSLLFHGRRSVGDTISRVTGDPYCVQTLVLSALLPFIQSVVTLVTMFLIMWQLNAEMTLFSLAIIPFLFFTIRFLGRPMRVRTSERRNLEGQMMSIVEQTLTAIPAVQAFTREERETAQFRRYAAATVTAYNRSALAASWFSLFAGLITAVGTAALIYLGGTYVLEGKISVGTLLVFIAYLAALYEPLSDITYTGQTLQVAAAQADRVFEILDTPKDVADSPNAQALPLQGHVRYENVVFGYDANRQALRHVSLEAHHGEVLALVGPTGAGKTTLVNLLIRFYDPWSGRITIDGHDLTELTTKSLRSQVAIVLQEPFLFPVSIADNISYGRPEATLEEIVAAADAAGAGEFIRRLPDGYATIIGERGATLSGGEKQRLSIARAFLKDAPILILDEPTSALDARTEARLVEALQRLMRGRTSIIIAHRLSTIRHADRVIVLDEGEIVEQGSHLELLDRQGLYARLYFQQMDVARHDVEATTQSVPSDATW